ncbi:clathrin light chain [Limtongia smithiae]|uniref:clathrin light chain n=1 Tax=Limtongia smithiae TaxID=1125753 RepID=UPI0034CE4329
MSYFPSLEEIDGGATEPTPVPTSPGAALATAAAPDGMSSSMIDFGVPSTENEFAARERAVLGDSEAAAVAGGSTASDLLNGDDDAPAMNGHAAVTTPNGAEDVLGLAQHDAVVFAAAHNEPDEPEHPVVEEEPDAIKEWRERRDLAVQRRDEQSESRKKATRDAARVAIDDFYDNYNNKKERAIAQTRAEEKEFIESQESTVAGGTTWERITKLVDLSDKKARSSTSDKTRFRELLLALKSDPNAPGAKGY